MKGGDRDALVRPADRAAEHRRRARREMTSQALQRGIELPLPRMRAWIIKRDHEPRLRRRIQPPLDHRPWLQIVGERKRTEVVTERSAHPCGDRQHGGDAGHDLYLERTPRRGAALDLFANGRRHREYAGIAATHQGDTGAGGRPFECSARAQCFLAIV